MVLQQEQLELAVTVNTIVVLINLYHERFIFSIAI